MPGEPGISWEGHLSGFISGFLLSFFLKSTHFQNLPSLNKPKKKTNSEDEFMKQFDENGNFRPLDPDDKESNFSQSTTADEVEIKYNAEDKD
jgi:hypothetical protein